MIYGLKNETLKYKTVVALLLASTVLYPLNEVAAKPKIPERIVHLLDSLYPGAKEMEWTKRIGTFRADFISNDKNISITFDRDAKVIRCKEEIDASQLSEKIANSILKECDGYKIVFILMEFDRGQVSYEIEIMKGRRLYILDFNEMGYLVDKSTVEKNSLYVSATF